MVYNQNSSNRDKARSRCSFYDIQPFTFASCANGFTEFDDSSAKKPSIYSLFECRSTRQLPAKIGIYPVYHSTQKDTANEACFEVDIFCDGQFFISG